MSKEFSVQSLKIVVGHICQNIGWHALTQSSLNILVDILQRYIVEIAKCTDSYTNADGRTESNTEDVFLAFRDFGITEKELLDYMLNVDSLPFPQKLPRFPVEQKPVLSFPKVPDPNRPEWIDEHFPNVRPETEEDQQDQQQVVPQSTQIENGHKRSEEPTLTLKLTISKKNKGQEAIVCQTDSAALDEGTPMREVGAVLMTKSGFLSAIREGKLPDPCQPSKLLLDPQSDGDSSDGCPNNKSTAKKRKRPKAESKVDKFFDDKPAALVTSIKIEKPVKEKKVKENKKGRKRKSPAIRSPPKNAKAARLAPEDDRITSPVIPKIEIDVGDDSDFPEPTIYSDNDTQSSSKPLRVHDETSRDNSHSEKTELLRGIDDAITSVIENARKSVVEELPDDRIKKKLQVDDFYDLSDTDGDLDEDVTSFDRPKTPSLSPEPMEREEKPVKSSSGVKASPLVELVRQLPPDQPTNEDSSSFLTSSVTITPIPPSSSSYVPPISTTLTVKTLAERKGLPPMEPSEDKLKKKDKKKEKKDKKEKRDKKKDVLKLTLKLSPPPSQIEQLFAPTPMVTCKPVVKEKPKEKQEKSSILKKMAIEVDSDSDPPSLFKASPPPTPKTSRSKEVKKSTSASTSSKKEKQTPAKKAISPLPPMHPELTITPIASSMKKQDKRKSGKGEGRTSGSAKKEEKPEKRKEKESKKDKAAQLERCTIGTTVDEHGNKIWICPACAKPDDGSPMIGCDECDDWYHWTCVGIQHPPSEDESWFCTRCLKMKKHPKSKK